MKLREAACSRVQLRATACNCVKLREIATPNSNPILTADPAPVSRLACGPHALLARHMVATRVFVRGRAARRAGLGALFDQLESCQLLLASWGWGLRSKLRRVVDIGRR